MESANNVVMSLIASFSGKLYGMRSGKTRNKKSKISKQEKED